MKDGVALLGGFRAEGSSGDDQPVCACGGAGSGATGCER